MQKWFETLFFMKYFPWLAFGAAIVCFLVMILVIKKSARKEHGWWRGLLSVLVGSVFGVLGAIAVLLSAFDFTGFGWTITYNAFPTELKAELKPEYHLKPDHFYKLSVSESAPIGRVEYNETVAKFKDAMKEAGTEKYFRTELTQILPVKEITKNGVEEKVSSRHSAVVVAEKYVSLPTKEVFTPVSSTGPSAGLMITLELIQQFGKEDLIRGRKIAGTGTINPDGTVGQIGSVKQKLLAAKDLGADICFVPESNYKIVPQDFIESAMPMRIIPVNSIEAAIKYLR